MKKEKLKNIIFLIIILIFIISQTRKPIQVIIHRGFVLISPSTISKSKQSKITHYNWKLRDVNNKTFNFKTTKGKVVFVNFWVTWCPPCIAEMPSIQKLYDDYKDKAEFVFISDESFNVLSKFLDTKGYTFKVYNPMNDYSEIFKVSSIPRSFLIDKKGTIIIDKTGAANWNSKTVRGPIDNLLK